MVEDQTLFAHADDGYWLDTGTPAAYLQANLNLIDGTRPGSPLPEARELDGGVWVTGDLEVEGIIEGPALAGAGSSVAAGATVGGSILGASVRVAPSALVRGSVLMDGVVVEEGASVVDSIVGTGATVGARAQLSEQCVVATNAVVAAGTRAEGARLGGPEDA